MIWRIGTLLLVCTACAAAPEGLATVGQSIIRQQDVDYRIGIAKVYGVEDMSDTVALISLVNSALEREVGRRVGVLVTKEELDAFNRHVEESSRAPGMLDKVKAVFGDDVVAYRTIYQAPKMINRKLRLWFSRDAKMQASQRKAIEQAYALAQSGDTFEAAAKATGLSYAKRIYETGVIQTPDALKPYFAQGMAALSDGFKAVLEQLHPREIAPTIIEDDSVYRVVRLAANTENGFKTVEITAPKRNYDTWFRKQTERVSISILDDQMQASLCSYNAQVYWINKLCTP